MHLLFYFLFLIVLFSFFPALYALGKQILNLSVDRAEIVLRPGGKVRIKAGGKAERYLLLTLLFFLIVHSR